MLKASDHFHGPEHYNCAQSVLVHFGADAETVAEFKAFGGGRAPEGLCGALHAARHLLNDEKRFAELRSEFAARTGGAVTCRELKGGARVPCTVCIDLAAGLLAEKMR